MTGHRWMDVVIGIAVALLATWLLLVVAVAIGRPKGNMLAESLRLLPDLLRLLRRIAADKTQPTGIRVRPGLLLAYLAFPYDPIPDFIPLLATPTTQSLSPGHCGASLAGSVSASFEPTGQEPRTASRLYAGSLASPRIRKARKHA
jgi:hypothetical protein